ncbi:hypothetical protein [Nocardia fusca]|uniref:Uncharacterized protein n=1 Tax=Nocardia fusca TaxID=941183 RepID=A0ABV3FIM1_9NOCA
MSLESRRERAERAILDAATAIPLPMDKLIMRHNAAIAAVRALWVSRRKWRALAAQLNNELGNVRASHSAAEHYIDELEDELRPLRVQRSDAYAILALVTAEVGASEDMRWEFLPEMVKALRVKAGELESQLNGGDQ